MTLRDLTELKILVVDDRAEVCELVTKMLARLGTRSVTSAGSCADSLRAIDESDEPFDVAIFDIDMPTDDGLVCLRKLAKRRERPAVILMSGKDPVVLESARRLGEGLDLTILGTLSKPLASSALKDMLSVLGPPEALARTEPAALLLDRADIERGLDERRFELWFQPQHHIASGAVRGVEALLRFRHDEHGLLAPDSFIKTAEDSGLMSRLTDFVLDQAAAWCAAWHAGGFPLTVSLNLSKAGLDDLTLPDRAAAICKLHGLAPSHLALELTESSLAADATALLDIMARLRLKGFRLSLDDFGIGYASLEELRSLPFHELKLDKQFVQSASHNPRSRTILESSVRLAAELKMTTVAEGVETDAMLQMVTDLGCEVAQGYLFGKAMPAADVLDWLRANRAEGAAPSQVTAAGENGNDAPGRPAARTQAAAWVLGDTVLRFAHDAASPMMMVLALSEMLLEDPALNADQRGDVRQIHTAAEEVTAMLKTLQKRVLESDERSQAKTTVRSS